MLLPEGDKQRRRVSERSRKAANSDPDRNEMERAFPAREGPPPHLRVCWGLVFFKKKKKNWTGRIRKQ